MIRAATRITLLLLPLASLEIACSRPPEQQMLTQFFRAARNRDNTTAAMMSAVTLDPRSQGSVEGFSITSVSPERREPLPYKALIAAADKARQEEADFQRVRARLDPEGRFANPYLDRVLGPPERPAGA